MSATAAVSTRAGLGCASAEEAAYTLDGGYALEPNADGTGGWLAHRASLDLPSSGAGDDWLPRDMLEAARDFRPAGAKLAHAPRVLVLYGSLRESSFSRRQIPERQTRSRASVWPRRENRALSLLSEPSRNPPKPQSEPSLQAARPRVRAAARGDGRRRARLQPAGPPGSQTPPDLPQSPQISPRSPV